MFQDFPASVRSRSWLVAAGLLGIILGPANASSGANLVAHWKLDETASPYVDSGGHSVGLYQDTATTIAGSGAGIAGPAGLLNWQNPPGVATRLSATNSVLQTDSFGFSFWLNPVYLNQNDDLIVKEMAYNPSVTNRFSWQVHVANLNGQSAEPVELDVYGDKRGSGGFYGSVLSATNLPLHSAMTDWIHVAGGYDSHSGSLNLFVNGIPAVSTNSAPGANNSDGNPFAIGTGRNGPDFVVFAAGAYIDDVQLYDGPLTAADVAVLMGEPGEATNEFVFTCTPATDAAGDRIITFNSTAGMAYDIQVSTNLVTFTVAASFTADCTSTTITLPQNYLTQVLGGAPGAQLFFRVRQYAASTPFGNCN